MLNRLNKLIYGYNETKYKTPAEISRVVSILESTITSLNLNKLKKLPPGTYK